MSMLHDDDDDLIMDRKAKSGVVLGLFAAVSAVVLVLLITFAVNKKPVKNAASSTEPDNKAEAVDNSDLSSLEKEKRTSDELSFWHMYDEDEANNTYVPTINTGDQDDKVKEKFIPDEEEPSDEEEGISENSASDQQHERDTVSGNVFDVNELTEGKADFEDILSRVPANTRYEDAFQTNGIWKEYALNGRKTSFHGIDVSSYQKNIDWYQVAASGVDFAMLKVGSRGYGSGKVVLDTSLQDNMRGCSENGIKIGLYFQSQATNVIEAVEEANYCIGAINGQIVEYPIVFSSEAIVNDSYRTENLSKQELSDIARTFCDTIRLYGYTPMIAATKKQFARKLDLNAISSYDLWLYDTDDISVFPYRYNMWQYSIDGTVEGITDPVNLDISFTDYSVK